MEKINSICERRAKLWTQIQYRHFLRAVNNGYYYRHQNARYVQRLYAWFFKPLGWWKKNKVELHRCEYCIQSASKRQQRISDLNYQDMLEELKEFP